MVTGLLGFGTLAYMAFGPMTCDNPCHGMIGDYFPIGAIYLGVMSLAVGGVMYGTYHQTIRGNWLGVTLIWIVDVFLFLGMAFPYAGVFLMPTVSLAILNAVIGTIIGRRAIVLGRPAISLSSVTTSLAGLGLYVVLVALLGYAVAALLKSSGMTFG